MITLVRGAETLEIKSLLCEAFQVFARQAGWQSKGAIDPVDRRRHSMYASGSPVSRGDAAELAAVLKRIVHPSPFIADFRYLSGGWLSDAASA
jgi:hypothetical protein